MVVFTVALTASSPSSRSPRTRPTIPRTAPGGTINRVNAVHSLLGAFMGPFKGVSTKHLDAYLTCFRWCRTFMATDSGAAERTVARQLAHGTCRSRIRDMFNVEPPYMDYWAAPAAQGR